jgi:hypothetical protein
MVKKPRRAPLKTPPKPPIRGIERWIRSNEYQWLTEGIIPFLFSDWQIQSLAKELPAAGIVTPQIIMKRMQEEGRKMREKNIIQYIMEVYDVPKYKAIKMLDNKQKRAEIMLSYARGN